MLMIILLFNIKNSISPLNKPLVIDKTSETIDTVLSPVKFSPPFISKDNYLHLTVDKNNQNYVAIFDSEKTTVYLMKKFNNDNFSIYGCAKSENNFIYILKGKNNNFNFIKVENDTNFNTLPSISLFNEEILSIAINNDRPEFVSIAKTSPYIFNKYIFDKNNNIWIKNEVNTNPFFLRISKPLSAFYFNGWYFLATSPYYLKENLYVKTNPNATNIMLFRGNYSNHLEDIIINDTLYKKTNWIDNTFSGIIENDTDCQNKYYYNFFKSELKKSLYPCSNNALLKVFKIENNQLKQQMQFVEKTDTNNILFFYSQNKINNISYIPKINSSSHTFFINNNAFAVSLSDFSKMYSIEHFNKLIFLLDNSEFCILDENFSRIDIISFKNRIKHFFKNNLIEIINNPTKFKSYTVLFIIFSLPLLLFLTFFIIFIYKVFLAPRRPSYSARRTKKTPLINFLMISCLTYLVLLIFYIRNFILILSLL